MIVAIHNIFLQTPPTSLISCVEAKGPAAARAVDLEVHRDLIWDAKDLPNGWVSLD